jgi:poly-gamma-glutamate capsule biosynthesis protein CapA/YwtB (metallophosphatase superfamily)
MSGDSIVLYGCGDVGPIHEPMSAYSELVRPTLAAADLRFAQCERVYSERGALQLHSHGSHSRVKPQMASVFTDCGFDVVSVASNHAMDWGADAMLDTIGVLRDKGIQTIGAGRNLEDARQPAIIERNKVRVAFLAYCSVLNEGYAAAPSTPGVAPLRARTHYEPVDYQAGVPPRVVTVPYEEDLRAMVDDITAAKKSAHIVVLSLHWGVHFVPRVIADYQRIAADAAVNAGADLILGHHAHVPKAIGVYSGTVCFYSLSNFIMSANARSPQQIAAFTRDYGTVMDPEYPKLPYGTDAKRSLLAKAVLAADGVRHVSFVPVLIDKQLRPEILREPDPRFTDAVRYMEWASEGFPHRFEIAGDEVAVTAA